MCKSFIGLAPGSKSKNRHRQLIIDQVENSNCCATFTRTFDADGKFRELNFQFRKLVRLQQGKQYVKMMASCRDVELTPLTMKLNDVTLLPSSF